MIEINEKLLDFVLYYAILYLIIFLFSIYRYKMNKIERQSLIIESLQRKKVVSVNDLSKLLKVSAPTVRRDLKELLERDLINRSHGYASLMLPNGDEPHIVARAQINREKKKLIGIAAAELIKDGETIYLSGGTTTVEVANDLRGNEGSYRNYERNQYTQRLSKILNYFCYRSWWHSNS